MQPSEPAPFQAALTRVQDAQADYAATHTVASFMRLEDSLRELRALHEPVLERSEARARKGRMA